MDVPSKVAAVFVGVGLAVGVAAVSAEFLAQQDEVQFRHVQIPDRPCASEDGPPPCFYDAGARGDGHGHSFWLDAPTGRVRVHYLDSRVSRGFPSGVREWIHHSTRGHQPWREPYGGCDEAAQPGNPVPRVCR